MWWSFFVPCCFGIDILSAVRVQSWWAYGRLMVGLPYLNNKAVHYQFFCLFNCFQILFELIFDFVNGLNESTIF